MAKELWPLLQSRWHQQMDLWILAWQKTSCGGRWSNPWFHPSSLRSEVPQGLVLGPCLFLVYINDLVDRAASIIQLFADDIIVYRLIASATDCKNLQEDHGKHERWESDWNMAFPPDKCDVLAIMRSRKSTPHQHVLHGKTLQSVTSTKYLGVTLQHDTQWNLHINNVIAKASKLLAFLRRNLKIGSIKTKELLYKALVRPLLQYVSTVWDPHTKDTSRIEMIQRRAARFGFQDYNTTSSADKMLHKLNRPSLEDCSEQHAWPCSTGYHQRAGSGQEPCTPSSGHKT